MNALKAGTIAAFVLAALIVLIIQALVMMEGQTYLVSITIALMVLMMMVYAGFYDDGENTVSGISWSALQAFGAGLMAYIVLSPITYEVENANFVMAYIVILVFCLACFDFEIEVYERERMRKEMK